MQLVERITRIMDILSLSDKPIGVSELSRNSEISKTAVFRIAEELCRENLLIKDDDSKYHIGSKVLFWAGSYHRQSGLKNLARPLMETIWEEFGETVHLFEYENLQAHYLDKIESKKSLRMWSKIGFAPTLYSTAGGKAILSYLSTAELENYFKKAKLTKITDQTVTDPEKLKAYLVLCRERGYSEEIGENEDDIRCVAAPILDYDKRPIGAISISAPVYRFDDTAAELVGLRLVELTQKLYQ
jgi:DNA-binding IclR family transcriptional regulator